MQIVTLYKKIEDRAFSAVRTRPLAVISLTVLFFAALIISAPFPLTLIFELVSGAFLLRGILSRHMHASIAFLLIFATALGAFVSLNAKRETSRIISDLGGKNVRVSGVVATIPSNGRFYLNVKELYYDGGKYDEKFKLYMTLEDENIRIGDRVTLLAKLYEPSFGSFDMSELILSKGAPLAGYGNVLISKGKQGFPFNVVSSVRNYLLFLSDKFFKGDARALFRAITAGDRSEFSDELSNALSHSGISHIAAISGLHVSLLGFAVFTLLKDIKRGFAAIASVFTVILFVGVAGYTPSAVRAAMMFAFYMGSTMLVRQNDNFTALSVSAAVMVLFNPYVIFDIGFILSYLSVLGIQLFSPKFSRAFKMLPKKLSEAVSMTLAAQSLTLPVVLMTFNTIAVYSVLTNIIVSFVFPAALCMCFIFSCTAFVPFISWGMAGVCSFLLKLVALAAKLFANLPMGGAASGGLGRVALICYGVLIIMLVFHDRISPKTLSAVVLLCVVVSFASTIIGHNMISGFNIDESSRYIKKGDTSAIVVCGDLARTLKSIKYDDVPPADVIMIKSGDQSVETLSRTITAAKAKAVYLPKGDDYQTHSLVIAAKDKGAEVYFYPPVETQDELYSYALEELF